jgi:hypothetical protein
MRSQRGKEKHYLEEEVNHRSQFSYGRHLATMGQTRRYTMFDKFKLGLICVTLCLTVPLTASAAKPDSGKRSRFFEAAPLVFCGDFTIVDDFLVDVSWNYFYDNDGNFVRADEHYTFYDDLYHEDFPDGIHLYGGA